MYSIDPAAEPDAGCIEEMAGADFAIPGEGGEITLEPYTSEEMGYASVIPSGWNELDPGIVARGNPSVDPTLLAQLSAPNKSAEELLGQILANLGIAELPEMPVRMMDSEALSWSLYLVTGDPTTAVALAESDTTTYAIILRAAGAEFDTLADGLLVPALMAFAPVEWCQDLFRLRGIGHAACFRVGTDAGLLLWGHPRHGAGSWPTVHR